MSMLMNFENSVPLQLNTNAAMQLIVTMLEKSLHDLEID